MVLEGIPIEAEFLARLAADVVRARALDFPCDRIKPTQVAWTVGSMRIENMSVSAKQDIMPSATL